MFKATLNGSVSQICDKFDKKLLLMDDYLRNIISIRNSLLIVLNTSLNPLSNGAKSFSMFHQKNVLNWK